MKSNIVKYLVLILIIAVVIIIYTKVKDIKKEEIVEKEEVVTQTKVRNIQFSISGLDSLNPLYSKNENIQDISKMIYEPLFEVSSDFKLESRLGTEFAKQNATTYLVKLRENVKWASSERFNADDVIFTIQQLKSIDSIYSSNVKNIKKVNRIDDFTIKIELENEETFFEYNLIFPIMCKSFYDERDFKDISIVPDASGMYKVSSITDKVITLVKNSNYWNREKELNINQVNINVFNNIGEEYNSFKVGNTDIISTDNTKLTEYIGTIGYNLKETKGRTQDFLILNNTDEVLQHKEVRQAILLCTDKNHIVANVYNNKTIKSNFPLDYGSYLYTKTGETTLYDIGKAKSILSEAGWKFENGSWNKKVNQKYKKIEISFLVNAKNTNHIKVAELIKASLEGIGIKVNIKAENEEYYKSLSSKKYSMSFASINLAINPSLEIFFGNNNLANYSNSEVNELLKELKNTTEEARLKEIYDIIYAKYTTDVPYISLYNNKIVTAFNNTLVGEFYPNWYYTFYNIDTWYK